MDFSVTLVKFDIFMRLEVFSKTSKGIYDWDCARCSSLVACTDLPKD